MFLWWLRNEDATARKLARAVHEVGERSAEEKINREFGKLDVWNSCCYIPGSLCVQRRQQCLLYSRLSEVGCHGDSQGKS